MNIELFKILKKEVEHAILMEEGSSKDWWYMDFDPTPRDLWIQVLDTIGARNIKVVAANSSQLPPNPMCRAQILVNLEGQNNILKVLEENETLEMQ